MKISRRGTFFLKNGFIKGKTENRGMIFFAYTFLILWITMSAHRVYGASSQNVSVTANVPVTSEYAFAIQKNSLITLVRQGEQLAINGTLRGPRDVALEKHKILLQIKDNSTETIFSEIFSETSSSGVFSLISTFSSVNEKNLQLSLLDMSFNTPLLLLRIPVSALPQTDLFKGVPSLFLLTERKREL